MRCAFGGCQQPVISDRALCYAHRKYARGLMTHPDVQPSPAVKREAMIVDQSCSQCGAIDHSLREEA